MTNTQLIMQRAMTDIAKNNNKRYTVLLLNLNLVGLHVGDNFSKHSDNTAQFILLNLSTIQGRLNCVVMHAARSIMNSLYTSQIYQLDMKATRILRRDSIPTWMH